MTRADAGSFLFGFGMGGLFDFMLLHLVLQWHHMISNRVPPVSLAALEQNNFWDGIGLGASWLITLAAVLVLVHAARGRMPTVLRFVGLFVLGWGVFNLVDGVFNHHVLALHNVRDDVVDKTPWNVGFLVIAGIVQPVVGWWIVRASRGAKIVMRARA